MSLFKRFGVHLLLFIGLISILSSCKIEEPTLTSLDRFEIIKMENQKADVEVTMTVNNPNSQKFKLKTATFDVLVNEIFIGVATLIDPSELPANGSHQVNLKVNLTIEKSITELATSLGMAILTNNITVRVKGDAKGKMGLLTRTVEIDQTEKIDWTDLKKMVM